MAETKLISLADITAVTGLTDAALDGLILYAQSMAEAELGFLVEVTKEEEKFLFDAIS